MSVGVMVGLLSLVSGLAAMLSAIAGIGGGTILIAAMYAIGLAPTTALALHAGVQMISNGSRAIAYRRHIDWQHSLLCAGVALPLPFLVAPLLVRLDADLLRLLLAIFVFANLLPKPARVENISLRARMIMAGLAKGSLGPIVGASGLVVAPFFFSRHWDKETTVASLAMVQAIGHLVKIIAYALAGVTLAEQAWWLVPLGLAVIAGTWGGKAVMARVSQKSFERIFRLVLAVLACKLLLDALI